MVSVSVVMPAYNAAATLVKAIESILSQRNVDFELIVVDDGSKDETPLILKRYSADSRVRVITQPNGGVVSALNAGVQASSAPYIARADADDYYSPLRLRRQLDALQGTPAAVLVCTNFAKVFSDGRVLDQGMAPNSAALRDLLFISNLIMHSSVMFRRDVFDRVGGYTARFLHVEDWDLWFRMLNEGHFIYLPECLSYLSVHSESVSAKHEISQARAGVLLRLDLCRRGIYSWLMALYLIRPTVKVILGRRGLSALRGIARRPRYAGRRN